MLLFFAIEDAECSADDFAGIVVSSALDLRGDKAVEFLGEIDIAGRHGGELLKKVSQFKSSPIGKDCQSVRFSAENGGMLQEPGDDFPGGGWRYIIEIREGNPFPAPLALPALDLPRAMRASFGKTSADVCAIT